jgi:hypothetical protein
MFSLEKRSPEEFAGERPIMSASTDATSKDFDNDFVSFLEFLKEMFTKYYDPIRKFDFLNVALDYYFKSGTVTLEYSDTSSFVDTCISLEALYNESGDDLRYKISHRLAFILSFDNFQSSNSFYNAKQIYKKRNQIVHGRTGKPDDKYLQQIRSYARRSCICFLILCCNRLGQTSKKLLENLLGEIIDEAMLDLSKREDLRKEIVEGMKDFAPKIIYLRDESEHREVRLSNG